MLVCLAGCLYDQILSPTCLRFWHAVLSFSFENRSLRDY